MDLFRSYWRWIALIGLIIILTNSRSIPWPVVVLALGAAAGYLLREGWLIWQRSGGRPTRSTVKYWRGQRIEVGPKRAGPALPDIRQIGPALLYFFFGGVLALVAGAIALQRFGV
jgi:hypothetical protein